MSYSKTTWASGDTITSEKLNHLEDGVYKATSLEVPVTLTAGEGGAISGSTTTDFADIKTAYLAGIPIEAKVAMPSSGYIFAKLKFVNDDDNPSAFAFTEVLDFSTPPETPEPKFAQIVISSGGVSVELMGLTVAS